MLAWVVINRQHPRHSASISPSLRTLCLCVKFSHTFPPTSLVSIAYALPRATATPQPLCNQSVTHSFYLDGGCVPLFPTCQPSNLPMFQRVSELSPLFSHSCALFCPFLHSPKTQLFYFQAIPHSLQKNGGGGVSAIRKFLRCSWRFSLVKVGNSPLPRHASHQSRVTKLGLG